MLHLRSTQVLVDFSQCLFVALDKRLNVGKDDEGDKYNITKLNQQFVVRKLM